MEFKNCMKMNIGYLKYNFAWINNFFHFIFIVSVIILTSQTVYADNNNVGDITGKVIDSESKDGILLVNIVIKETGLGTTTNLDPKDIELNETLAYRSKHMFDGSISGRYLNMELGFDYKYYHKLEVVKVYPMYPRVVQEVLDGHFSLNINNMFNHMHTQIERTIMPIRNYTATIRYKL